MKEYRLKAGLTQEQVAKLVDVDQGAVSNWEVGKYKPVRKYREKLAKLYGCTEEEIRLISEAACEQFKRLRTFSA